MNVEKVLLIEPRGFCAGVQMAIKALSWMVRVFDPPIYCNHEIVHNQAVVKRFSDSGVTFVDSIDEIPDGAAIMLSAHGSAPEVVENAKNTAGAFVNAVCPLVTKVHHEMKVRTKKGATVIYVGHEGHQEAIGTMAVAEGSTHLVGTVEDLKKIGTIEGPVALLSQTTLSQNDYEKIFDEVQNMYPEAWRPKKSDLCYATTNRQRALRAVVDKADSVVVVGSANSSNTIALTKVAKENGAENVYRVNKPEELPVNMSGVVAVTAGASAPDEAVQAVVTHLAPKLGVEVIRPVEEEEYFPPPRELREILDVVGKAACAFLGANMVGGSPLETDRSIHAQGALESM